MKAWRKPHALRRMDLDLAHYLRRHGSHRWAVFVRAKPKVKAILHRRWVRESEQLHEMALKTIQTHLYEFQRKFLLQLNKYKERRIMT
jgi:hypothetical protein